jgi:hypothetical protein
VGYGFFQKKKIPNVAEKNILTHVLSEKKISE